MTPVEALQGTLAAEHAALYGYGVLGGRVSAQDAPALAEEIRAAYSVHRDRRDRLTALITAQGDEPVAAAVSYVVPTPARTTAQCREAARLLERRCADVYASAVGSVARLQRPWAIEALTDAAVRGLRFGEDPSAFPGAPEL